MKKNILKSTLIKGLMFFMFGIGYSKSFSQVREWTNGPGTTSWNTTNWNGSTLGGFYGQLEWRGGGNVTSNNDIGSISQWRLYFIGSKAYTLTGSSVSLFDNSGAFSWILNDATVAQNINLPINFADVGSRYSYITNRSSGSLTFGSGNNIGITGASITALRIAGNNTSASITFNGTISGSRPIDIGRDDANADQVNTRVVFNGNNSSYSGVTTLYAGTLTIPSNSALGSGLLILGNSLSATSTLAITTSTERSQGIQINNTSSASVIDVASGQTFELTGVLSGGATNTTKFGKSGTGTLTLSGTATYNGQIQIGEGSVIANSNTAISTNVTTNARGIDLGLNVGDVSTSNNVSLLANNNFTVGNSIYVASNASNATRTIGLNGSGAATFSNEIYMDGILTIAGGSGSVNLSGRLTNTGGIIASSGIVNLTASNNNYSGTSTINSGAELRLNPSANATFSSQIVLNGGTLSTTSITSTRTFTSSSTLNLNASSTIALGTGNHTLTFANSSAITWNGTTLTITGWGGTAGQTNTNGGKIFVGVGGLTGDQLAKISFLGYPGTPIILGSGELVPQSPLVTFSNTQFTGARNITRGITEVPIYRFEVNVTGVNATLNSLSFTTPVTAADGNSNYVNTDITNFKAFLTTNTIFSNSNQLGSTSPSGKTQQNAGETLINFTSLATTLNVGTTYYIWLTADVLNGAVAGRRIVVNAPTVGITGSVSGTNSATGVQTIEAVATNYYLNVGGSVTTSSNYFTQPNGGGTSMTANSLTYTSNDVILNIPISVTNTGDFTLGNGSKIVVQNGGSLTVGSANTITGTIDVNDGGTLTFNNTNISSTLGTLGSTSTIIYGASGAQAVTTRNYGNLTVSGGNTKTISGAAAVSGTLTINGTVLALGINSLAPNTLTLDGLGTKNGSWGSTAGSATYKNATYFGTTGTGTVTPSINTAATASFSNISTSQSISYGTATVSLSGKVASGAIYPANGETVSVTINGVAQTTTTTSGDGSFAINHTTSTLPVSASPYTITYAYTGAANGFLQAATNETSTALTVNAATNNWIGGTGTWSTPANWSLSRVPNSLNDNITISSGTPTMDANYILGAGRTLTISGTGALVISPSGSITIAGAADFGARPVTVQSDATGTGSIGTISGTLNNASNVSVERYISGAGRYWRFLSSPIQSATVSNWMSQFYVTGPCTLAPTSGLGSLNDQGWHTSQANIDYPGAYNASTNNRAVRNTSIRQYVEANATSSSASGLNAGWADVATNTALTPGKGFRAFIRGPIGNTGQLNGTVTGQAAFTLSLNGTVNQGAVNAPTLTYSGTGLGWNLVGNPYPCAYNWSDNATVKTNIVNTVHVFDATSNGYKSYNTSSGGTLSNGVIPSGAAFFVQATGSGAALTFNEAAKITGTAPIGVHKGAKANEFSIKYSKDTTENDEFILMVIDNATLNSDSYDIIKLRNENLNLSAYGEDSTQLTLSAIPSVVSETRVKLNVEATTIGTYNFDFKNMDNFQNDITVHLFDRYTNKTIDVKKNTKYTFDMGPATNQWGNNRFELIMNLDKTNVEEFSLLNKTHMLVYPNPASDVLNININNANFKNSEIAVYNISGIEVIKTNMASNNSQLNIESLSNGVYFVKVSNQNGFNKTVKFVK